MSRDPDWLLFLTQLWRANPSFHRRRFKIQQDGLNGGVWGTSKVIENGGLHSIKIPDCIADGQYLLRAEMIALHGAGSSGGAQLYVSHAYQVCAVQGFYLHGFSPDGMRPDQHQGREGLGIPPDIQYPRHLQGKTALFLICVTAESNANSDLIFIGQ